MVVIALVPAIVLAGLWRWAAGQADAAGGTSAPTDPEALTPAAPPAPPLSTPLLSFRRVPGAIARDISRPALRQAVEEFGATLNDTSCVTVALDGVPVASVGGDRPVIPASNQKVVIGAVALEVLGPDAVYTTEVRSGPVANGVVAGDLYLVGGGDPLLTSSTFPVQDDQYPVTTPTSLDALADGVVAAGVQRIDGAIIGDAGRYDDEWFVPSWDEDIREVEAGPYDALMVNDARRTGSPARVANPAIGAAEELGALLADRGVVVGGGAATGSAPPDATTDCLGDVGTDDRRRGRAARDERRQHGRAAGQGAGRRRRDRRDPGRRPRGRSPDPRVMGYCHGGPRPRRRIRPEQRQPPHVRRPGRRPRPRHARRRAGRRTSRCRPVGDAVRRPDRFTGRRSVAGQDGHARQPTGGGRPPGGEGAGRLPARRRRRGDRLRPDPQQRRRGSDRRRGLRADLGAIG